MKSLELKIPPLPLALGFGVLMWAIDRWLPMQTDRSVVHTAVALAIFGFAVAVVVAAIVGFRKARTTVDPVHTEAASAILTTGIYRFTRNPMYLGFLLALIAWVILLRNVVSASMPLIFVGPITAALHA
jgi:protein-S-isoprenylcysteine O-methyltransferase Ste14